MDIPPVSALASSPNGIVFESGFSGRRLLNEPDKASFGSLLADNVAVTTNNDSMSELRREKSIKEFNAVLTQQFLGPIVQKQLSSVMGEGIMGDFQASVFLEAVSEQLAETDAFGIKALIENRIVDK